MRLQIIAMDPGSILHMWQITPLDDEELENLYTWVDGITLSRPKRNMARDFSDGVLVAEVIKCFLPKLVDLHNYVTANATRPKEQNWYQLNRRVLKKLGLELSPDVVRALVMCKAHVVEFLLKTLREHIDAHMAGNATPRFTKPMASHRLRQRVTPESEQFLTPRTSAVSDFPFEMGEHFELHNLPDQNASRVRGNNRDVVSKSLLEEKQSELDAKHQVAEALYAKIQRLEQLARLKDIRIDDLTARLTALESHVPEISGSGEGATPRTWLGGHPGVAPAGVLRSDRPRGTIPGPLITNGQPPRNRKHATNVTSNHSNQTPEGGPGGSRIKRQI